MKKLIALLLCVVCLLASCTSQNETPSTESKPDQNPNDFNQLLNEDTTIFGQIQNKKGDNFTIALMKNIGDSNLCPALPGGDSEIVDNDATVGTAGEGVAEMIPDDMEVTQIFLDFTGETITIVFDKDVPVSYPNGESAGHEDLSVGARIGIILDEPGGKVIGIILLG